MMCYSRRQPYCRSAPLLLLLLSLLFPSRCHAAFSVVIPNGEESCFVIRAAAEKSVISGNYDLLDDGLSAEPISVVLYDEDMMAKWESEPGESEGTFDVHDAHGRFELCLRNGFHPGIAGRMEEGGGDDMRTDAQARADGHDRHLGFALRVHPPGRALEDGEEGPDEERAQELLELAEELLEDFDTMTDHQDFLREREEEHRLLSEQTNSRIMKWTLLEAFTLIVIASGQVLYLRRFFEQRRYL